jgi:putative nucleotidyltransferase with HDIG domain
MNQKTEVGLGEEWAEQPVVHLLERLNQIAATSLSLDALLLRTLGLLLDECQSESGVVYLLEPPGLDLVCRAVRHASPAAGDWIGQRTRVESAGLAWLLQKPIHVLAPTEMPEALQGLAGLAPWESACFLPLSIPSRLVGLVQIIDPGRVHPGLLRLAAGRMVTEIDKAYALEMYHQEYERKDHLISILGQIGATLNPDEVLRLLIDYGRQVIHAEACSLFLKDEETGESVLHLSTNSDEIPKLNHIRVPRGQGLIGSVIESGKPVLVPDVSQDERFYKAVDQDSGFVTRDILTVPLRAISLTQGVGGFSNEQIVGGLQALNKLQGTFDEADAAILNTLAQHAATLYRMAKGVEENNQLSMDMIEWMVAAIDARDPYTEGHSKRVSDFSIEIARQIGLSADVVELVRIGSLLHDIGKIGVPDAILSKPERLTDEEYNLMKEHPMIGARMMSKVRRLHVVLPALAEHHERLDGKGYPRGLQGEQISLFGRIVAVADVFDAMTSKRPYREGAPAEDVLDYLYNRVNIEFDTACVDALTRAYMNGAIKTQKERQVLGME